MLGPDDSTIWGIPSDSEHVLVLNCFEQTVETFECVWANPGTHKWNGGVLAPNGVIFGVPSSATKVLAINTQTRATHVFGDLEAGASKYSGGILGPDKRTVFFVPSNSEWVLAVDSETWRTQEFGQKECDLISGGTESEAIPIFATGSYTEVNAWTYPIKGSGMIESEAIPGKMVPVKECKWCGGALGPDKRTIFCIPSHGTTILAVDTEDLSVEQFGNLPEGGAKWGGVVVSPDGKTLFGIPLNSESVVALNMEDRSIELFGNLPGTRKWKGGVLGPDGVIYGVPACHANPLQIDTWTRKVSLIPGTLSGEHLWPGWKWSGGILHPGTGTIFCIPTNSHSILAIGPIGETTGEPELAKTSSFHGSGSLPTLRSQSSLMTGSMERIPKPMRELGLPANTWRAPSPMLSPQEVAMGKAARDTRGTLAAALLEPQNQPQERRLVFQPSRPHPGKKGQLLQTVSLPRLPGPHTSPGNFAIARRGPTRSASAVALSLSGAIPGRAVGCSPRSVSKLDPRSPSKLG